jgi:hypothetical protein
VPPGLGQFITHRSGSYPALEVAYEQGAPPTLTLQRDDGTTEVEQLAALTFEEIEAFLLKLR